MPNTLAHLGAQSVVTRGLLGDIDSKWIYAGCILPDVPWIVQRIVRTLAPTVDPVLLRYYVDVQGSLIGVLTLCGVISLMAIPTVKIFVVLAVNAGVHLALDAFEIKWANGVHLLVPFSWEQASAGVVWPDSWVIYTLTVLGVVVMLVQSRESVRRAPEFRRPSPGRLGVVCLLALIYFVAPFFFVDELRGANVHYLKTLASTGNRSGHYVEFDRAAYVDTNNTSYLQGITREKFAVEGLPLEESASVSIRGVFKSDDVVRVIEYHVHPSASRNAASVVGLACVAFFWCASVLPSIRRRFEAVD